MSAQKSVPTWLAILSVMIGLVGILNAGFLTWSEITGNTPPCSPPFQCLKVLESPWLNLGPVPFSVLGTVFFGVVLGLGSWLVLSPTNQSITKWLQRFVVVGGVFGLYTFSLMALVIQGFCLYCLVSDLLLGALFSAWGWFWFSSKN